MEETERGQVTGTTEAGEVRELGRPAPGRAPAASAPGVEEEGRATELPSERPEIDRERSGVGAQPTQEAATTPTGEQRPLATHTVRELAGTDERGTGATGVRAAPGREDREGASERLHGLDYRITAIPPERPLVRQVLREGSQRQAHEIR